MILASGARRHGFEVMYLAIRYQVVSHTIPHGYGRIDRPKWSSQDEFQRWTFRLIAEHAIRLRHGEQHKEILKNFEKIKLWKKFLH